MELEIPALLFFDPASGPGVAGAPATARAVRPVEERRLFCVHCRHPVTHQDERISVQGSHEHHCTNPHGASFHIGCFRGASGCSVVGPPSTEHTWFAGCAWRIGMCVGCGAHLGWRFDGVSEVFFGLILARLVSQPGP
jgi:hypothetical protein